MRMHIAALPEHPVVSSDPDASTAKHVAGAALLPSATNV
jgi:hypothetical protein